MMFYAMPKIPDCDRCSLYAHNPHLVCAVHPDGVNSDGQSPRGAHRCLDFRPDPNIKEDKQWSPEGYSWYGDELIADRPSRYTLEEQSQILDNHPFFTGVCPECRHRFDRDNLPVHFDCPECPKGYRFAYGLIDDSV